MFSRRRLLSMVGAASIGGVAGCTDVGTSGSPTPQALQYTVPALADGTVPRRLTCDGEGVSPRVEIANVPPPTESIALVFTYPDDVASQQTLWTMWDIPPETTEIPANVPPEPRVESLDGAAQGRNARGDIGYLPVCPPPGDDFEHWFTLYALRRPLDLEPGAPRDAIREELETATLASQLTKATYRRATE
ncbi:YbhB/YbcL family Raf kinase inhibitor-like protein [Halorarius litoreus]|uniref:YbhB/YbcL family Raf kinase inhibitor-like protein n=1 Tax=Halorarius litoreus TaxID=2962676 RepID=UPI0020CF3F32|nr:YbhB/YbcL family Raf kinase inhibitor-like protein [Halorarius litoreus]